MPGAPAGAGCGGSQSCARRRGTPPVPAAEVRLMMLWPMREVARICGMMSPHRRSRRRCSGPPPVPAARGPSLMGAWSARCRAWG